MLKVGDRVAVTIKGRANWLKLKNAPATVMYIDQPTLYTHHMNPVQVELDEPYDEHGQKVIRVSLKEVKPLEEDK
ncbi:hypothetical protein ABES03_08710 [Neobacillus rhizosphaerae]|uniref:hypothetical protein n=1 Tax=Neobacillus rhizosphaerae TaxID=2880965 RepID=UPI003D26B650